MRLSHPCSPCCWRSRRSARRRAADPLPFERGSWAKLRAAHAGQPTVIHFWGLTCGPCLVELPQWGKLQAERPDLRLVLIAADPLPQEPERVAATLARAGLGSSRELELHRPLLRTPALRDRSRPGPANCRAPS